MAKANEKELGKLLHDKESGDVFEIHGNVIFNTKKQKPHEQSRVIDVIHKIWDFFDLDDEKVLGFVKRNTIERFKRRHIEDFDLDEFVENAEKSETESPEKVVNDVKEKISKLKDVG